MINHKKCISCKRVLTLDLFGSLRSTKDGYSTRCKGCTNHASRKSYANLKDPNYERAHIYEPLRSHNGKLLKEVLTEEVYSKDSIELTLFGTHASSDSSYKIIIEKGDAWAYTTYGYDPAIGLMESHMCNLNVMRLYFLDTIISMLQRLEIRLVQE